MALYGRAIHAAIPERMSTDGATAGSGVVGVAGLACKDSNTHACEKKRVMAIAELSKNKNRIPPAWLRWWLRLLRQLGSPLLSLPVPVSLLLSMLWTLQ